MESDVACIYETEIEWTGGCERIVRTYALPRVWLSASPERTGSGGDWSPEHLFVATVNSSFISSFLDVAEQSSLKLERFECSSLSKLERCSESGYRLTEIKLRPKLVVKHYNDARQAMQLIEKAQEASLTSNPLKAINVQTAVVFQAQDHPQAVVS